MRSTTAARRSPRNIKGHDKSSSAEGGLKVQVSQRFIVLSLLSCILVAFAVGRTARMILLVHPQRKILEQQKHSHLLVLDDNISMVNVMKLPNPVLKNGKQPPPTLYTAKNFDTAKSVSISSRFVVTEAGTAHDDESPEQVQQECKKCSRGAVDSQTEECLAGDGDGEDDDDEEHLPVGQHLLMDIRNVDAAFLASEERLANVMLKVVGECGLTLLSYHCHGLQPSGVSCVGVLLESHVSFHTWPVEGVITLDLFTCGPTSLLPIVTTVETMFSVPRPGAVELEDLPETIWAYKWRGYGSEDKDTTAELTDLFTFPIGAMTEYKKEIASTYIGADRIDVYDVLRPSFQNLASYKRSLQNDDSYEAQHQAVFQPDRILFINGVLESRRSGESSFYELLVHPAMFAHKSPKRVGVIGFGGSPILREVLKHNTVEQVVMIEYREGFFNMTQEFFPEYNDCSFLVGGTLNCLDDPRVTIFYEDASDWFAGSNDATFDVIIMDDIDFVGDDGAELVAHLSNAMSDAGVLVATAGEAPSHQMPSNDVLIQFADALADVGFETVRDYEESHVGFEWPWRFVLGFQSFDTRTQWFSNEAHVTMEIRKRAAPTIDGSSPFLVYDGATQVSVMYPSRLTETVFCRDRGAQLGCEGGHGFDPEISNLPSESVLEARRVREGSDELGVFAKEEILSPSYIGLRDAVDRMYMPPLCDGILMRMGGSYIKSYPNSLLSLEARYGQSNGHHGLLGTNVPSSIHAFIRHGCGDSSNVGEPLGLSETQINPKSVPEELKRRNKGNGLAYNPALERRPSSYDSTIPRRKIQHGEEILVDQLTFVHLTLKRWEADVMGIQDHCSQRRE